MQHQNQQADFIRNFFIFLNKRSIKSAILHGGKDGFEQELSDIDFVVEKTNFPKLSKIINEYCEQKGWMLCQILRHETTAAYFVCAAADNPSCAVALDACSDYQRNGTIFLSCEEILEDRTLLPWGAYGLAPRTELRYRIVKAAAKNKNPSECAREFMTYPEVTRDLCAIWLEQHWGISSISWDSTGLSKTFTKLRSQFKQRPTLLQIGAPLRVISRMIFPTGIVVIAGTVGLRQTSNAFENVFAHLYFRRFMVANEWTPKLLRALVTSTLIIVPEISSFWCKLIPTNCIFRVDPAISLTKQMADLAQYLHRRCEIRENLV